jgi:hypothetical protein
MLNHALLHRRLAEEDILGTASHLYEKYAQAAEVMQMQAACDPDFESAWVDPVSGFPPPGNLRLLKSGNFLPCTFLFFSPSGFLSG